MTRRAMAPDDVDLGHMDPSVTTCDDWDDRYCPGPQIVLTSASNGEKRRVVVSFVCPARSADSA